MKTLQNQDYYTRDEPDPEALSILGSVPKRWGRMDRISRIALVEVGRVLRDEGLIDSHTNRVSDTVSGGLVGATRRGPLATDLAFAKTASADFSLASPLLFSYTLANISLSEAAGHYRLTGPVYSIYSSNPYEDAILEARRWMSSSMDISFMLAGELDYYPGEGMEAHEHIITSRFSVERR